ncbi:MAG: tetratricopeptide repeat protein [Phaeodactylibacter sp.]|nr:tetratricopeptide repeat protein [Phaeodactylibacter sp.]
MKQIIIAALCLIPSIFYAQAVDSLAIENEVDSLIELSKNLIDERQFDKALAVNEMAEKLAEGQLGNTSAAYARSCLNHGVILSNTNDLEEAEKWYLKARSLYENEIGTENPDYATCLFESGYLKSATGQYAAAEDFYLQSKSIIEKTLGNESPRYGICLNALAILYWRMGRYDQVEQFFLEAKDVYAKAYGKEHVRYAATLSNLGGLYNNLGEYEKAEVLLVESIGIKERTVGREHPSFAQSLVNLGNLYADMGRDDKAELQYLEAIRILAATSGKNTTRYASSLGNLAILYNGMGYYEKAELLYLESNAIKKSILGVEHPSYAVGLNNLGILYMDMGNYEKAEAYMLEAKETRLKTLGRHHEEFAGNLVVLGRLHILMAHYPEAERFLLEAKAIFEEELDNQAPILYLNCLNFLANLYTSTGSFEKAEQYYLLALSKWEETEGKDQGIYAIYLDDLGMLYTRMGKYQQAEAAHLEANSIFENTHGKEHADYSRSLQNLGNLYVLAGQYQKAGPLFSEASALRQSLMLNALHHLSEPEMNEYLGIFSAGQAEILSLAYLSENQGSAIVSTCFDDVLFYKGFLLNSLIRVRKSALSNPDAQEQYQVLKSYERQLAKAYASPVSERDSVKISELREKANALEKGLARTVAGYDEAIRQVKWQEVRQNLKADEAALEFVHFPVMNKGTMDSVLYAVLLLRPEDGQPRFIPLFEEKQLQQLISGDNQAELIAAAYATRGVEPRKNGPLKGIYDLLWKPLEEYLENKEKIYFSPSGLLHRINFNAIPTGKGDECLADRVRLVRLGSTRSLAAPDRAGFPAERAAILYGGIQYELDTTGIAKDSVGTELWAQTSLGPSFSHVSRNASQRGENWQYLPGTKEEIDIAGAILRQSGFNVREFSAKNATEASVKAIGSRDSSPRLLHLATHGFFFPDLAPPGPPDGGERRNSPPSGGLGGATFKISQHPMIRSGLVLTGGNYAWQTGKPWRPDQEDGILTAYEISQMDLSNTELVILSACETGLGDIEKNEGVYGLQRAFKIAGAKYLMMSLWQVPDKETKEFMVTFYQNWLEGGMAIPDAFRKAQLEMKERFENPNLWAGFVLVE